MTDGAPPASKRKSSSPKPDARSSPSSPPRSCSLPDGATTPPEDRCRPSATASRTSTPATRWRRPVRLPLADHEYGAHHAVLPPDAQERHDAADIDPAMRLAMYRKLQEMRQFEKRAYDLFMRQLVKGTSHLSLGMEAIAAGFGAAMRPDDYTFATYRGHAHTLARGVPMTPVLAELLGRANGLMGGKGGSMHLTSVGHGMMGSYAIIGAHLTIAKRAAWSGPV